MRTRHFAIAALMTTVAAWPAWSSPGAGQDPHQHMQARGAKVMGFDQEKTAHHFYLYPDGGAIDVGVHDASDTTNRDAIRAHLPHIAMMFGKGDFSAPMMVHDTKVPGTDGLANMKDRIGYRYVETPKGGRVEITTTDADALAAVHEFLRYQIRAHKTGDSLDVKPRGA
jgi:hypothetical protein